MEMTPDTIDFNSLSKKQLVELVIAKYNDCFRLEEENKKLKEYQQRSQSADGEQIERLLGEKIKLEEENKKLKSDLAFERNMLDNVRAEYDSLQNVIGKLKETIKDHQLYEEKLEHRIIEFEELLHGE